MKRRSVSISEQADGMIREVLADLILKGEKSPSYSRALNRLVELGYEIYKREGERDAE